ncbi:T9SS type A sorting domain-containing protein, partial [Candidatus Poribacteria bacterium]|nr:T9SS type A sorting domain-containing protein [Candidatus Poribacteria bacterium]
NLINTLTGHTATVNSVSFSPDGSTIASGSTDGTVLLWRLTPTSATITFNPDSVPDQTFEVGTPVDLMLPAAIGGTPPYTYTLSALPIGLAFDGITRQINGTPTTVGTTNATYTATDNTGASASLTFTITVEMNLDINADGQVNVIDLMWVAMFYGTRGDGLAADVNADGIVNVEDFAAVAAGVDAANPIPQWAKQALFAALEQAIEIEDVAAAPMQRDKHQRVSSLRLTYDNVAAALSDVSVLAGNDVQLEKWLPLLEELLHLLAEMQSIPETTALLANYPNPFNPETWIPYQLATPADVKLTIYDIRGRVVRDLDLGHQRAGMYQSKSRAAYWDGRNAVGEPVASGLYFYTLTAGEFSATRKLLIRK